MQINDKILCAWAGTYRGLTTGKEYIVKDIVKAHGCTYVNIIDDMQRLGSYDSKRFILSTDVDQQNTEKKHGA